MNTYTHIYIYIYTCIYIYIYVCIGICVCMYVCMYSYTYPRYTTHTNSLTLDRIEADESAMQAEELEFEIVRQSYQTQR